MNKPWLRALVRTQRHRLVVARRARRGVPVLIYQMGKVGSSSLYASLSEQYTGLTVHTHDFRSNHADYRVRWLYRRTITKGQRLKVITLTREPVSRNVSAFFQNFQRLVGVATEEVDMTTEELRTAFLARYPHELPLTWFDDNILECFGINVFAQAFPKEGIARHVKDNIDILIMRSEIDDDAKSEAVRNFLGLTGFRLRNVNISAQKPYGEMYGRFVKEVRLPPGYIENMCASRYFRHFYGVDVRREVEKKWQAP
ncbi:hypothetical protein EQG41_04475 [Billgrantia azerbaijanica]|nr:hypothetical protein EQG41_04475 [Halomonas azerbaijanica]